MTNKKELKGRTILGGKYRDKHHKEVSEYIHRMLRYGHHEKDVKKALLFVGWPKDFVEKELVRTKNFLIKEKNKIKKYLLGRLLFVVILFMMIVVYILLIFNKVFIGTNYFRFVFVYIIFSLLLVSWVILLHPLIVHAKRLYEIKRDIKEHEKVRMLLEKRKIMPLQHQAELEKERKKAEKLKLKEEKKRIKEQRRIMKEKEREARLILRKERGVFSKFFIRKTKEEKKELKPEKEEIPAVKREEKKAPYKKVGIERKKLRIFYFILFLLFIVSAVVASAWNMISAVVALVLAIVFLVVFIKTRKPKEEIAVVKEKPKEEIAEKEKAMVKELPKGPIELGRYETDLDALYKLIEQRGAIRLSAIAKYFGINKKKAEEWATILQDHNLAEIRYPAIGEPELAKFGLSKKEIKALLRQQKLITKKSLEKKEMAKTKARPVAITVIAILFFISAGLSVIEGVLILIMGSMIVSSIPIIGGLVGGFVALISIFGFAMGAINFLVGWGLWKLRNWARIIAVIFSVLVCLTIIGIPVGAIFIYLLVKKDTKEAFGA